MSDGSVINVFADRLHHQPGNSGGPLFNQYGEVIGIVNAKYSSSGYSPAPPPSRASASPSPYADVSGKIADLMQH